MPGRAFYTICATLAGVALFAQASNAASTSSQHSDWTKKFETPGGTFAGPVVPEADPKAAHPDDTTRQHEQWIKKLGRPGGTLSRSLDIEFGINESSKPEQVLSPIYQTIPLSLPIAEMSGP